MEIPRFIGAEIYRHSSYGAWHPLRVPRVSTVMDMCRALDWFEPGQYLTSPRAKPAALLSFHTPEYVAALQKAETDQAVSAEVKARHALGTHMNPIFPEIYRRPATSAGAAMLAGELLKSGGVIYTPAGGTHHGFPDRAGGFCYLNDPVLAIHSLQRNGAKRVAYIDIDAHHPDGVEHAFENDPEVLMISVHEENRWPRTGRLEDRGAGQVYNLPVPAGMNDDEMAQIREGLLLPLIANFSPDAIVLQCGADALLEDPQSRLALSNNAHWAVVSALKPLSPRFLVLGGGGYNPWSVGRCWTGVWATLTGREIPDRLDGRAEAVLRDLKWEGQTRIKSPPEPWVTTLRDPARNGPVSDIIKSHLKTLRSRAKSWA